MQNYRSEGEYLEVEDFAWNIRNLDETSRNDEEERDNAVGRWGNNQ